MTGPAALYQTIRRDIEDKILSGVWGPGYRIPYEHELVAQYGCARMTVNKAITSLVEAGLITRRRRSGSFVAEPHVQSLLVLDIPDIESDIVARGRQYGLKLLSRRVHKAKTPAERVLAGQGEILSLRCLHLANDVPFALEDRQINLSGVPSAREADFAVEAPGTWLLAHVAWTEAEHRITAMNPDLEVAELLDLTPSDACLMLERRTWRGSDHITHVRQTFPGAAYDLIARFTAKTSRAGAAGEPRADRARLDPLRAPQPSS
jgi:GntR family histidine utilization transcriptional repressor